MHPTTLYIIPFFYLDTTAAQPPSVKRKTEEVSLLGSVDILF